MEPRRRAALAMLLVALAASLATGQAQEQFQAQDEREITLPAGVDALDVKVTVATGATPPASSTGDPWYVHVEAAPAGSPVDLELRAGSTTDRVAAGAGEWLYLPPPPDRCVEFKPCRRSYRITVHRTSGQGDLDLALRVEGSSWYVLYDQDGNPGLPHGAGLAIALDPAGYKAVVGDLP